MDTLNLEKVVAVDPVVDVEETWRPKEVISRGGVNKSIYVMKADSVSDQALVWNNITPPSLTTVVQRVLRVQYTVQATVTYVTVLGAANTLPTAVPYFNAVTAAGAPALILAGMDAGPAAVLLSQQQFSSCCLRAFPLQSCASSIEVRINGNATSVSPNDYICIAPHLLTDDELNKYCSDFPCQKDNAAAYLPLGTGTIVTGTPTAGGTRSLVRNATSRRRTVRPSSRATARSDARRATTTTAARTSR